MGRGLGSCQGMVANEVGLAQPLALCSDRVREEVEDRGVQDSLGGTLEGGVEAWEAQT
jgi:hypothetical protein